MKSGLFKNLSALNEHHEVKAIGHAVLLADKFTSSLLKILKSDDFESQFLYISGNKRNKEKIKPNKGRKDGRNSLNTDS